MGRHASIFDVHNKMEWVAVSTRSPPADDEIDVRGLLCPLPVLKARKRLQSMKTGQILRILATDPAAAIDFPHFCSESGNELLEASQGPDGLQFIIRKNHGK